MTDQNQPEITVRWKSIFNSFVAVVIAAALTLALLVISGGDIPGRLNPDDPAVTIWKLLKGPDKYALDIEEAMPSVRRNFLEDEIVFNEEKYPIPPYFYDLKLKKNSDLHSSSQYVAWHYLQKPGDYPMVEISRPGPIKPAIGTYTTTTYRNYYHDTRAEIYFTWVKNPNGANLSALPATKNTYYSFHFNADKIYALTAGMKINTDNKQGNLYIHDGYFYPEYIGKATYPCPQKPGYKHDAKPVILLAQLCERGYRYTLQGNKKYIHGKWLRPLQTIELGESIVVFEKYTGRR